MSITVYTDGNCFTSTTRSGGLAYIIIYNGIEICRSIGFFKTTNNRMELQAAIIPLEELQTPNTVDIFTDSQYTINCALYWGRAWEKRNWIKKDGTPVANIDLIKRLNGVMRYHNVRFHWVRGHSGDHYNELCDKLAKEAGKAPTQNDDGVITK